MPLRVQETAGGVLQASKWLSYPLLIDSDEMEALLAELGDFDIYRVSGVSTRGEERISRETFLQTYNNYIHALKRGESYPESLYRSVFSSVFSVNEDALFLVYVGDNQQLVKIAKPVIQLQSHRISYSPVDGKFRSMVWGPDSISWGIQFSYPQIFQDFHTKEVRQIADTPEFPNTALFRLLQRWGRYHTVATPFIVDQRKVNVPIRLGKRCFPWINNHPQLISQGLSVQK